MSDDGHTASALPKMLWRMRALPRRLLTPNLTWHAKYLISTERHQQLRTDPMTEAVLLEDISATSDGW